MLISIINLAVGFAEALELEWREKGKCTNPIRYKHLSKDTTRAFSAPTFLQCFELTKKGEKGNVVWFYYGLFLKAITMTTPTIAIAIIMAATEGIRYIIRSLVVASPTVVVVDDCVGAGSLE